MIILEIIWEEISGERPEITSENSGSWIIEINDSFDNSKSFLERASLCVDERRWIRCKDKISAGRLFT